MKKTILFIFTNILVIAGWAQALGTDSLIRGKVTITKDSRIELLGKKMAEYNEGLANKIHLVKGFRLTLLSTTDRNQAIQIRSQLMQQYPDQSVYMTFQSPYIRLKFGNFLERTDAEQMRKDLMSTKIIPGNIYIVPEMVETRPDKNKIPVEE